MSSGFDYLITHQSYVKSPTSMVGIMGMTGFNDGFYL